MNTLYLISLCLCLQYQTDADLMKNQLKPSVMPPDLEVDDKNLKNFNSLNRGQPNAANDAVPQHYDSSINKAPIATSLLNPLNDPIKSSLSFNQDLLIEPNKPVKPTSPMALNQPIKPVVPLNHFEPIQSKSIEQTFLPIHSETQINPQLTIPSMTAKEETIFQQPIVKEKLNSVQQNQEAVSNFHQEIKNKILNSQHGNLNLNPVPTTIKNLQSDLVTRKINPDPIMPIKDSKPSHHKQHDHHKHHRLSTMKDATSNGPLPLAATHADSVLNGQINHVLTNTQTSQANVNTIKINVGQNIENKGEIKVTDLSNSQQSSLIKINSATNLNDKVDSNFKPVPKSVDNSKLFQMPSTQAFQPLKSTTITPEIHQDPETTINIRSNSPDVDLKFDNSKSTHELDSTTMLKKLDSDKMMMASNFPEPVLKLYNQNKFASQLINSDISSNQQNGPVIDFKLPSGPSINSSPFGMIKDNINNFNPVKEEPSIQTSETKLDVHKSLLDSQSGTQFKQLGIKEYANSPIEPINPKFKQFNEFNSKNKLQSIDSNLKFHNPVIMKHFNQDIQQTSFSANANLEAKVNPIASLKNLETPILNVEMAANDNSTNTGLELNSPELLPTDLKVDLNKSDLNQSIETFSEKLKNENIVPNLFQEVNSTRSLFEDVQAMSDKIKIDVENKIKKKQKSLAKASEIKKSFKTKSTDDPKLIVTTQSTTKAYSTVTDSSTQQASSTVDGKGSTESSMVTGSTKISSISTSSTGSTTKTLPTRSVSTTLSSTTTTSTTSLPTESASESASTSLSTNESDATTLSSPKSTLITSSSAVESLAISTPESNSTITTSKSMNSTSQPEDDKPHLHIKFDYESCGDRCEVKEKCHEKPDIEECELACDLVCATSGLKRDSLFL